MPRKGAPSTLPSGWQSIYPSVPSAAATRGKRQDPLGLARAIHPLHVATPRVADLTNNETESTTERRVRRPGPITQQTDGTTASPRHRRLVETAQTTVAEAFSPSRSLRQTVLKPLTPPLASPRVNDEETSKTKHPHRPTRGTATAPATAVVPLHEVVQTFDDAVDASPLADSNQAAITELFIENWLAQFDRDRSLYKSVAVHAEIGFQELFRLTANLAFPNGLVTAFACKVFDALAVHFGPYAELMRVLSSELRVAVYAPPSDSSSSIPLPYFALVKSQKRLVLSLQKDRHRRLERNGFLRYEIDKVHATLLTFLDHCAHGLVRTLFREWHAIAVVRKRNTKKYIAYFSGWFSGSAQALVPKIFVAWKHFAVEARVARMKQQLTADESQLLALQQQIDELGVQRDRVQLEHLAIRNDRKQAEDTIQRLHRKIQSASAYLDGSARREGLVALEGQLRVEAVTFLPPLVLESLLRGFHNVGFLQQLHREFLLPQMVSSTTVPPTAVPSTDIQTEGSRSPLLPRVQPSRVVTKPSLMQDCLSAILKLQTPSNDASSELSLTEFVRLVQEIQDRMHDSRTHLLFSPRGSMPFSVFDPEKPATEMIEQLTQQYERILQLVRLQDEHYARNSKLFMARMLEAHEVSVTSPTHPVLVDQSVPSNPSGDLGMINGAKRFSLTNLTAGKPVGSPKRRPAVVAEATTLLALDQLEVIHPGDFSMSSRHTRHFMALFLGHLASEYGSLLFAPSDLSAFMRNTLMRDAMLRGIRGEKHYDRSLLNEDEDVDDEEDVREAKSSPTVGVRQLSKRRSSAWTHEDVVRDISLGIQSLLAAFDGWNRISLQLIEAQIVQARGTLVNPDGSITTSTLDASTAAAVVSPTETTAEMGDGPRRGSAVTTSSASTLMALRPRLHLHIEPLPQGVLMTSQKDRDTPGGSPTRRLSLPLSTTETYHSAKIRHVSLEDTEQLIHSMKSLHGVVQSTATRFRDFAIARQQLKDFRLLQWQQASELASQFMVTRHNMHGSSGVASSTSAAASSGPSGDPRSHLYECVSFDNAAIARLLSVEEDPEDDLNRVCTLFERKKHILRHLYVKYRPGVHHAMTLDDMWHLAKVLRLPKEVHVLPAMRDEELTTGGYEQLFSPSDVAEVILQLCNEQFLPSITPLSARVEHFLTHHLPLAFQNQSIIREVMYRPDVKKALSDHSQTLRIIFRRYCVKDKDAVAIAARRRVHGGLPKFLRLADWHAFLVDYKLLRGRFTTEYATTVFRNVQEAESGQEDHLEMIYSEFCEGVVAVSVSFFPDPFLGSATRVHQFIRRYLPVSPEETREHTAVVLPATTPA
ncbi:hypothetical protein Poli38472_008602 [Pythium oligandrum]|uniref:Calponin-homology (CH) domain-containing protein n=1 Tax=Pythium oligandrum TaxID=41045 RepID=A0A8K1C3V9_PYTOL|nr:hypothetical protein Poli38472_008602 [Pythium oligandrum]|eukprot:TMW55954.1 hypothetical protein Poli38472_008602 [Pythium oligandrum]